MTVKLKQTNIPWLGEIPDGWEVKRLKDVCSLRSKRGNTKELNQEYVGLENIKSWDATHIKSTSNFNREYNGNVFLKNDILFSKLRPYLAKGMIAQFDGISTTEFMILYNFQYHINKFLMRVLLSGSFIFFLNSYSYGSIIPRVNWNIIGSMAIPTPPLKEQEEIARYLDEKSYAIDKSIGLQKTLIEKLKEYKKSLIYECVTKGLDK